MMDSGYDENNEMLLGFYDEINEMLLGFYEDALSVYKSVVEEEVGYFSLHEHLDTKITWNIGAAASDYAVSLLENVSEQHNDVFFKGIHEIATNPEALQGTDENVKVDEKWAAGLLASALNNGANHQDSVSSIISSETDKVKEFGRQLAVGAAKMIVNGEIEE